LEEPEDKAEEHLATDTPAAEDKPSVSTLANPSFSTIQALKGNQKLVDLLKDAYEVIAAENGWANLTSVPVKQTRVERTLA